MRTLYLFAHTLTLCLTLGLGLAAPAFGLRPAGLEESAFKETVLEELQAGLEEPEPYDEAARKARRRVSGRLLGDPDRFPQREFFLVSQRGVSITKDDIARWSQGPWLSGVRVINPALEMGPLAEVSFLRIFTKAQEVNRLPPVAWPVNVAIHSPNPWDFYLKRGGAVEIWGVRIEEKADVIVVSPASEDPIYLEIVGAGLKSQATAQMAGAHRGRGPLQVVGGPFRGHREAIDWLIREKVNLAEIHGAETDFILLDFVPPAPAEPSRWQSLERRDWPDRILELMQRYNPDPEARPYQVLLKTERQFRGREWAEVKALVLIAQEARTNLTPEDPGPILAEGKEGPVEYETWVLRQNAVADEWVGLPEGGLILSLDDLSSGGVQLRVGTSPGVQWRLFWAKPPPLLLQLEKGRDPERPLPTVRVESPLGADTAELTYQITGSNERLSIDDVFEVSYHDYENMRLRVSPSGTAPVEIRVRRLSFMAIHPSARQAKLQETIYRQILDHLLENAPAGRSAQWHLEMGEMGEEDEPLPVYADPKKGIRFFRSRLMRPPDGAAGAAGSGLAHASFYGFFQKGSWDRQAVIALFPMFGAIPTSIVLSYPEETGKTVVVRAREDEENFLVVKFAPVLLQQLRRTLPLVAGLIAAVSDSEAEKTRSGLEEERFVQAEELLERFRIQPAELPGGIRGAQMVPMPERVNLYAQGEAVAGGLEERFREEAPEALGMVGIIQIPLMAGKRYRAPGAIVKDKGLGPVANPLGLPVLEVWLVDLQRISPLGLVALALRMQEPAATPIGFKILEDERGRKYLAAFL